MAGEPQVSVLMAVHNGARFLSESLESVFRQTFADFEFIVIDDGSTDDSRSILERYAAADPRLRIVRQEHLGLAASLNRGIALARGKYVARIDADDTARPDRFDKQVRFLEAASDVAVLGSAYEAIGPGGEQTGIVRLPARDAEIKRALISSNCMAHPTVMARTAVLRETSGYRRQFLYAEDYDLWLRIAERYALANLDEPIQRYRLHRDQVSFREARQQALSALAARVAFEERCRTGVDPFGRAERITEELLFASGVSREEIERAIWSRLAARSAIAARLGPVARERSGRQEKRGEPRVSVIVPCYNQGRFLGEALESVLAQTYDDWECIVVDDGSSDDTARVASQYAEADERFCYIEQGHRGVAEARNRGLRVSRGRYIQFLDADDAILPDKINLQLGLLARERSPALAYCDYYRAEGADLGRVFADDLCQPRLDPTNPVLDIVSRWEDTLSIPVHCFLFDRRLFQQLGIAFDTNLRTHEDWDCWVRLFRLNPSVVHVPRRLAVYRRHEDSTCADLVALKHGFEKAIEQHLALSEGDQAFRRALRRRLRKLRRRDADSSKLGAVAARARRIFRRTVPWPVQKMIGRIAGTGSP